MSFGIVLTSSILALVFGCLGSWVYMSYLGPMLAKTEKESHAANPDKGAAQAAPTELTARIDDFSEKLSQLQSQVDHLPKPATAPDLEPLNNRLSTIEDLPRKIQALEARVNAVPTKVDQESRKITTLMADMEGMKTQVSSLRNDLVTATKGGGPAVKAARPITETSSSTPREIEPPVNATLQPGIELFRQKHHDQASEFFSRLTRTMPDDARVWYFAALARGLTTKDWKGETERLVNEGVQREKAGKPAKPEIDSAFADLTPETGKDWLAFYRRRIR
jgi:hypothetical protein